LLLRDIYFEHNTFGPHGNNLFANHPYGTADPVIDGVYFRYNNLKGTPLGVDSVVPNVEGINAANQSTFRRHNYQFIGNVSDTVDSTGDCNVPHWAMRFWGIDGLVIANNVQPVAAGRCMTLLDAAKLRSSRITGDVVVGAIRIAARYYESSNYCEAHNLIGKPLTADTSRLAPRCA
jgi:hypothetical protein